MRVIVAGNRDRLGFHSMLKDEQDNWDGEQQEQEWMSEKQRDLRLIGFEKGFEFLWAEFSFGCVKPFFQGKEERAGLLMLFEKGESFGRRKGGCFG